MHLVASFRSPAFSESVTKLVGTCTQWNKLVVSRTATAFISPARVSAGAVKVEGNKSASADDTFRNKLFKRATAI
jgi:hypothetical protein